MLTYRIGENIEFEFLKLKFETISNQSLTLSINLDKSFVCYSLCIAALFVLWCLTDAMLY